MHDKVQARIERVITAEIISLNLPVAVEPQRTNPVKPTPTPKDTSKAQEPPATARTPPLPPVPLAELVPVSAPESAAPTSRESATITTSAQSATSTVASQSTSSKENAPSAPPPAPPRIELPSSNADYLNNPAPPYPAQSKRLGEQGKLLLHVFVSATGAAEKVEIRQSSGFERLDQIALETVKKWKFVPGKRNGNPEAMWVNVPLVFELG
ncbi:MAG: energy transducer TonB [Burkholderiales bacterium]|nr:MAG: energy transducer TonB [Burkholderiales bacterium]TAG79343.1 MAG: energy transducer TonB [Betaproteobacteria bacterium]